MRENHGIDHLAAIDAAPPFEPEMSGVISEVNK
jgi:hypothetical protein